MLPWEIDKTLLGDKYSSRVSFSGKPPQNTQTAPAPAIQSTPVPASDN